MQPWLNWAKQIKAIAQAGETYGRDKYDLERYQQLDDIAHQMFAYLSDAPVAAVEKLFIPESGYPTPKIDLRAGVIKDGKILLVREREDDCWTLPGGWGDVCETPKQGVVREVLEESGFVVDNPRLIAVKDRAVHPYQPEYPFHIYKLFFSCATLFPVSQRPISKSLRLISSYPNNCQNFHKGEYCLKISQ
ncbi:NUDIX hydrolase N-terminal domain-containing protein [Vibrio sinaloensis]|nr:NUDIX hydrolase N-terminal domain-containing protein [Vibrio sinaloensis]